MIKTQYFTPEIYTRESRSFQLFGHLYDLIFNYFKMCTDSMVNNPISKDTDYKLLDLITATLGFESRHNYNVKDLFALCLSFEKILKHKGSLEAITEACNVLVNAQGINYIINPIQGAGGLNEDNYNIFIQIPSELKDLILLEDLFDYILPAGFNYEFSILQTKDIGTTQFTTQDSITSSKYVDGIGDNSVGTISKGKGEPIKIDENFTKSENASGHTWASIVSTPNK